MLTRHHDFYHHPQLRDVASRCLFWQLFWWALIPGAASATRWNRQFCSKGFFSGTPRLWKSLFLAIYNLQEFKSSVNSHFFSWIMSLYFPFPYFSLLTSSQVLSLPVTSLPPSDILAFASISLLHRYNYDRGSDVLHYLVLPAQTFTSRKRHAILTVASDTQSLPVPLVRSKSHADSFFPRTVEQIP